MTQFVISDQAAHRILFLTQGKPDHFLRIRVDSGGCSGFQYEIDLDDQQTEQDLVFMHQNARIIIDDVSLTFLSDSVLDYIEDLGSAQFLIKNPNANSRCGCGNSFSL